MAPSNVRERIALHLPHIALHYHITEGGEHMSEWPKSQSPHAMQWTDCARDPSLANPKHTDKLTCSFPVRTFVTLPIASPLPLRVPDQNVTKLYDETYIMEEPFHCVVLILQN